MTNFVSFSLIVAILKRLLFTEPVFFFKTFACLPPSCLIWVSGGLCIKLIVHASALTSLLLNDGWQREALPLSQMLPRPLDLLMTIIRKKPPCEARQSD